MESTNIVHSSTSNNLNSTQLSKNHNIKEISRISETVTSASSLSKNVMSKKLTKSPVDVTVKTPTNIDDKTTESQLTSTTPTRKTVVNKLEQSKSSVEVTKPNEKTISSTFDSQSKNKNCTTPNLALAPTLQDPITPSPAISNPNPVGKLPNASEKSEPIKRKRGRPRKLTSNSVTSSIVNGIGEIPEPQYVIPDIIDEAELYGINEKKVSNIVANQDVSAANTNCLVSDSSEDYNLEEQMHQEDDDDDRQDTLQDFSSLKHKVSSTSQKKDNNCQLSATAEHKNIVDKEETNLKAEDSVEENEMKSDEEEEYTCSACNVRFTSICEHIREFHNGEEVVVEVSIFTLKSPSCKISLIV